MVISCVMSIYNEEIWMIKRAIDSVLHQTVGVNELIVVVDNPENKKAIEEIQKYNEERIKLIINEKNVGLACTLNRGFDAATGDLILRMDADDESLPTRIEMSLKHMREYGADIVTTAVSLVDKEGKLLAKQRIYPCSHKAIAHISQYCACVFHPTWLLKKEVWEQIGGYREQMIAAQDYDFVMRALKKGYRVGTVKEPQLRYTVHEKSISGAHTARQAFLALYAQANVYRKKEFKHNIHEEIRKGENGCFSKFEYCFNKFYEQKRQIYKVAVMLWGCCVSVDFKRYIYNAAMQKFLVFYYLRKEV